MEFLAYALVISLLVIVPTILIIVGRKKTLKKINSMKDEFLTKRETTLESELQRYIYTQNPRVVVKEVKVQYAFKCGGKICLLVKFMIENNNTWYSGMISEYGTYTGFNEYAFAADQVWAARYLQKIYSQPKKDINTEYIMHLPVIDNIHKFNIENDEKVIFNTKVKKFTKDDDVAVGYNVKFTITSKRIYINNGAGIWNIDLYNDIANYTRKDNCIDITLTEICSFGISSAPSVTTGFKFYFDNGDINKLEELLNSIIK